MITSAFGWNFESTFQHSTTSGPRLYHCTTHSHPHNGSLFHKKSASSRDECLQAMRNPPVPTHIRLSVANPQARDQIPDQDQQHPSSTIISDRIAMDCPE
jgi:hypothetical protein